MVIGAYIVTIKDTPCTFDRQIHAEGVLVPCQDGQAPEKWTRDWDSKSPLSAPKARAETAIRRTLDVAKKMRGSMVDGIPRVRRFLEALAQGIPTLTEIKEPSRTVRKPREKKTPSPAPVPVATTAPATDEDPSL